MSRLCARRRSSVSWPSSSTAYTCVAAGSPTSSHVPRASRNAAMLERVEVCVTSAACCTRPERSTSQYVVVAVGDPMISGCCTATKARSVSRPDISRRRGSGGKGTKVLS